MLATQFSRHAVHTVVTINQHQPRAALDKLLRDGQADAGRTVGDQHELAGEVEGLADVEFHCATPNRSGNPVASIDVQRLRGEVAELVAGQDDCRTAEILRIAYTAHRHRLANRALFSPIARPSYLANSVSTVAHIGVWTTPGAMPLTRMPCGAIASAADWV